MVVLVGRTPISGNPERRIKTMQTTDIQTPIDTAGQTPEGLPAKICSSVDYSVDIQRGPDVHVASTIAGGKLKLGPNKMQWKKLRKIIEEGMATAERGNFLTITIQFQPFASMTRATNDTVQP